MDMTSCKSLSFEEMVTQTQIASFHYITMLLCKSSDFGLADHMKKLKPLLFRALELLNTDLRLTPAKAGMLVYTLALEYAAFILLFSEWVYTYVSIR